MLPAAQNRHDDWPASGWYALGAQASQLVEPTEAAALPACRSPSAHGHTADAGSAAAAAHAAFATLLSLSVFDATCTSLQTPLGEEGGVSGLGLGLGRGKTETAAAAAAAGAVKKKPNLKINIQDDNDWIQASATSLALALW